MIDLAPNHKIGLPLETPVMIASGFCGYGDAYAGLIDLSHFGAVVTQPITLRPQPSQPRLAETTSGLILDTGQHNPGIKKVLRQYRRAWSRLETQVIIHLPADEPNNMFRTARALASAPNDFVPAAVELGLPINTYPDDVHHWVNAIQDGSELPILVKLPLNAPLDLVEAVNEVQADALVIGTPPPASAFAPHSNNIVTGRLYGPALHNLALLEVQTLANHVDLPIIAAGGIHSLADIHAFLTAGAQAIQLDSLLFIDPAAAEHLAKTFNKEQPEQIA